LRYIIVGFLLCSSLLAGQKLTIEAKKFFSDENKGIIKFTDNVLLTKANDSLSTNKLVVTLNEKKKAKSYETFGVTSFIIELNGKIYKGSCDKVIFNPIKMRYILTGNVHIEELKSDNRIDGEKIVIDKKNKRIEVKGDDKKPVKFTFDMVDGK